MRIEYFYSYVSTHILDVYQSTSIMYLKVFVPIVGRVLC